MSMFSLEGSYQWCSIWTQQAASMSWFFNAYEHPLLLLNYDTLFCWNFVIAYLVGIMWRRDWCNWASLWWMHLVQKFLVCLIFFLCTCLIQFTNKYMCDQLFLSNRATAICFIIIFIWLFQSNYQYLDFSFPFRFYILAKLVSNTALIQTRFFSPAWYFQGTTVSTGRDKQFFLQSKGCL